MKKDFATFLKTQRVLFDGAFGTVLQSKTDKIGTVPERLNLTCPELIAEIHREYAAAGADVISANTFGANGAKAGADSDKLIAAAVNIARSAAPDKFVALDLGPTGLLAEPVGTSSFEELYDIFASAVKAGSGADLILIETMSDMTELRAALLAARENSALPVIASMTFAEGGRTFTGVSPETFALVASPLADAIGVNCSLGPKELLPIAEKLVTLTRKPIIVQANAGLPDERSHYAVSADEFAEYAEKFLALGVRVIGGCCGTTPEFTARLRRVVDSFAEKPFVNAYVPRSAVCSATKTVLLDGVRVIGERINPTGKKAMKQALLGGDMNYIATQAIEQAEAGADILDVNAGLPELDEKTVLPALVKYVQKVTDLPLQIDSSDPKAVENALRAYNGKAIINSVNGEERSLSSLLPLAAKYGAAIVGLTVDERGVPETVDERIRIAEKIISRAQASGIPERDVYIDCLTLTVGAQQEQACRTLEAIRRIKAAHEVKTVLGVSNISFGLPARRIINSAFLTAALWAGLDLPILNPCLEENMQAVAAYNVLSGADKTCAFYSEKYAYYNFTAATGAVAKTVGKSETDSKDALERAIYKGLDSAADETAALLDSGISPLDLVNDRLIPALGKVGDDYEKGVLFLPSLLAAADSAKRCFDEVKKRMPAAAGNNGTIVLATVKGDVHDIGKNIARTVLENYGYKIIDLGKNVEPDAVVRAVEKNKVRLCGLSALMTTTVPNMAETIRLLKARCPYCKIMVGGAVLTEDYARKIGADFYCKDVNADVRFAREVFGK